MNFLPTARGAAVRLVLGILVVAAAGLWDRPLAAADGPHPATLRPTADPTLLPVEADEPPAPTTMRVLTAELPVEPRAGQTQLRLLPSGELKGLAPSGPSVRGDGGTRSSGGDICGHDGAWPSSDGIGGHDGAWPSSDVAPPARLLVTPEDNTLPRVVGSSDAAPSILHLGAMASDEEPPSGPWCFAGDSSPAGESHFGDERGHDGAWPSKGVVAAAHQEVQPAPRLDAKALLAILEEEPTRIAQDEPEIPRVLPPPHAMLPPDPAYDDARGPAEPSPFRDEARGTPTELPPRQLPASTRTDRWQGRVGPADNVPSQPIPAPSPPSAARSQPVVPDDFDRELEEYQQYQPPRPSSGPYVAPCNGRPCRSACDDLGPRRLLHPSWLECRDVTLGGWIDQGITGVGNNPLDRYNGPVTFNDRYADYQMNQLYVFLERETCTDGGGWDFGGRIDFLYGTDARFVKADDGLEANWGQTHKLYQAALPQFYVDAAWNDLTVRLGHFYKIMGYEEVPAPCNFFYSHSYAFQYGEPFTYTGMMASYDLEPGLSAAGGFSRGVDQFDDTDGRDQLGVLAAIDWASCDGRRSVQFGLSSGEQGPDNITTIYSLVGQLRLTDRLSWILEHNYGQSTGGNPRGIGKAEWYGLSQYVLYQCSETFGLGARIEWFCDEDGTRVRGLGEGNMATGPYPGSFYEITLGANWRPGPNVMLRPEIRWDWYNGVSPQDHLPYDAGQSDRQLLYGFDLVVQF